MKLGKIIPFALLFIAACSSPEIPYGQSLTLSREVLADKIRGGWFGQTIGCTYGGPTEFKHKGGLIPDSQPIPWYDDYIYDTFIEDPGLYDDVYMDLTFLEVIAKHGLETSSDTYANAFAEAEYKLWHANQCARYNILNGIKPAGHWKNNPHADDIDFQIEADFIGMLYPGMPNAAAALCDTVGHIMNYGDGWYGGVYTAAMYTLAYVCEDIPAVVTEALKTIPEGSGFKDCIQCVIDEWKKHPKDWKKCWFEVNKSFADEIGCPDGVWNGLNIDAKLNAAYVVIGLLYGNGDFEKTMEISTRCGQDSDCNPASAAGILGVMYGYSAIPDKWKPGAEKIANLDFPYTKLSLNSCCEVNMTLIKDAVCAAGGQILDGNCIITVQKPVAVRLEQSFEGLKVADKKVLKRRFNNSTTLDFKGTGVVVEGAVVQTGHSSHPYVAEIEASLDGKVVETFKMPHDYIIRKYDVFSLYGIEAGSHTLTLKVLNPSPDFVIEAKNMVIYDNK
jgi:hypothetical protein